LLETSIGNGLLRRRPFRFKASALWAIQPRGPYRGSAGTGVAVWRSLHWATSPRETTYMKRFVLAGATTIALVLTSQAFAQTVKVEINPEQRTRIKEYVVKEKVPRATVTERVTIGRRLPDNIELRAVPSDWGPSVSRYKYIYSDDRVHFVDPATREVIYDID